MIMSRHSMTMSFSMELLTVWIHNGLWFYLCDCLCLNAQHLATVMHYTNSFNLRGSSVPTIVELHCFSSRFTDGSWKVFKLCSA